MDKKVRDGRRGPRSFDRDGAVETAMRLFWRHGYEGVSVADLTAAIGIAVGTWLSTRVGSRADRIASWLAAISNALPGWWAGIVLISR